MQHSTPDHSIPQPTVPDSLPNRSLRLPLSIALSLAAVVLAAGSGAAWWTWKAVKPAAQPVLQSHPVTVKPPIAPTQIPSPIATPQPAQPTPAAAEQTVQVYWLKSTDDKIELVAQPIAITHAQQPEQILTAALEKLLAGASDSNITTIPQGTTLRSVGIAPDGIHIDLSSAFKSGGGSTSMTGRVGQILYTATAIDPNAKVWISVNGEPLQTLGGEGLEIEQPMTRRSFEQNFSL